MTNLIVKPLKRNADRKTSVVKRLVHRDDGTRQQVFVVDTNSPTIHADLGWVFRQNVAKAKRNHVTKKVRAGKSLSKATATA